MTEDTATAHQAADDGLTEVQVKLFTLARASRARGESMSGAAVVDTTGRSYSAAAVSLPHVRLSALALAVATAAAAGAEALADAVVVGGGEDDQPSAAEVFGDLAVSGAPLLVCAADRRILARWTAP